MSSAHASRAPRRFPNHGWLGIVVIVAGEAGLLLGVGLVSTFFTPIMWTGYILLVDGLVRRLRGRSWLTTGRREFPLLVLLSVLIWLLFEAYNLRLKNWLYVGLPSSPWLRDLGYFWSFATIMPAIFLSADLVAVLLHRLGDRAQGTVGRGVRIGPRWAWFLGGVALVTIPAVMPTEIAPYTFAAVWLGFIFLVDPLNDELGGVSLRQELARGQTRPLTSYLLAGLACGFLWETWNVQAMRAEGAHWIYTVPAPLRLTGLHFGQMPIEGLLGFPPFALELRALYTFLRAHLGGERVFGPPSLNP